MVCTPGLEWWPVVFGEQKDKLDIGFQHKICYPLNDTERFEQNFDRGHAEKAVKDIQSLPNHMFAAFFDVFANFFLICVSVLLMEFGDFSPLLFTGNGDKLIKITDYD